MDERTLIDRPLAVSEINAMLRSLIKESFYNLCIEGEVSTFRPSANGHWYFKLKDEHSQIDAVMFRSANAMAPFVPKDGDLVQVRGGIDVYESRGTYQIIVQSIEHAGLGAILEQLEKRKAYYQSLGWFDAEAKPPLPRFPRNIGVVTATTGAAIRDILDTTRRRAPSVDITIYPTLVQGDTAAGRIAAAIRQADELGISDVLIVGRGGGSMEDLLPFSDDEVVRAIHECSIPVISAVGHEIDTSLSDYVATRRAITPTDGAAIATEGYFELSGTLPSLMKQMRELLSARYYRLCASLPSMEYLEGLMARKVASLEPAPLDVMRRIILQKADSMQLRLSYGFDSACDAVASRLDGDERRRQELAAECDRSAMRLVDMTKEALEQMMRDIGSCVEGGVLRAQGALAGLSPHSLEAVLASHRREAESRLASLADMASMATQSRLTGFSDALKRVWNECEALNPAGVLARGYSIAYDAEGRIVRSTRQLHVGDSMRIRVGDGSIAASVTGKGDA